MEGGQVSCMHPKRGEAYNVFLRTVLSIQRTTQVVTIVFRAVILTRTECNIFKTWVLQGRNFARCSNLSSFTALFVGKSSMAVLHCTGAGRRSSGLSERDDK